jgi:uncharacterized protein (TIGR02145 family)
MVYLTLSFPLSAMRQFTSTYKSTLTALFLGISLLVPCSRSSAQTLPDYLPTDGLVAWWPFNGNANDESGNGNHGVNYGGVHDSNRFGIGNSAMFFSGNSCSTFVQAFVNTNSIESSESYTLSLWVRRLGQGCMEHPRLLEFFAPQNGSLQLNWGVVGDNFLMVETVNKSGLYQAFGVDYPLWEDNWAHLILIVQESDARIYLNSSLVSELNYLGSPNLGSNVAFGRMNHPAFNTFKGNLDDIGIWNRALTDAEVMALYLGEPPMWGCVDPTACNFNPEANADDGSCVPSGCTDAAACNFDADAGCDDGSCAPADAVVGCMEPGACNFNAAAVCAGTCVYPAAGLADCAAGGALCGDGMIWDVAAQTCTIDPDFITSIEAAAAAEAAVAAVAEALDGVCGPGTVWDSTLGMCTGAGPAATCASDLNGNGAVEIQDLLILLSDYETLCPVPEPVASACGDLSAVSFDGYSYPLVAIGSQCWFQENLRSDNYRNGDPIPGGLSNAEWTSTTAGAQAVYNEDPANMELYGRLYNWYAVNDARGLCPTGWHVPTDGEWMELEMELGMTAEQANSTGWRGTDQGAQLKATSSDSPSWNGSDSSGFSALPGGYRNYYSGIYFSVGSAGYWWSSSSSGLTAWYRGVDSVSSIVDRFNVSARYGFAMRCLKD